MHEGGRWVKWVKYVATERNLTMGGEHTMQCTYMPYYYTPETYWISLINVTIIKQINKQVINTNRMMVTKGKGGVKRVNGV